MRTQVASASDHADLPGEIRLLVDEDVADDLITVATTAARTLLHLRRYAGSDVVEVSPGRLEQPELPFQLLLGHRPLLERGWGERDAPKVGRSHADVVLDDLEGTRRIELGPEAGEPGDGPVPVAIRLEKLDRLGPVFAPRLQPGQSMAKAATFLSFGPCWTTVRVGMRATVAPEPDTLCQEPDRPWGR